MHRLLSLEDEGRLPIKAFEQKDNTLFIRTTDGWKVMSQQGFEQLVGRLSKLIVEQLVVWQEANTSRLRRALYKHLRLNLRNVVQYEFTY